MIKKSLIVLSLPLVMACSNDIKDINALVDKKELNLEKTVDVEILYSDSAVVRMKISAPELIHHISKTNPKQEFNKGLHVDFYDNQKNISAWLDARYAVRMVKEEKIITRDSVVLVNQAGDLLKSPELHWDQKKEILFTDHFVQIIQNKGQDTINGYGFETDKDFKKFKIKQKFSTKRNVDFLPENLK